MNHKHKKGWIFLLLCPPLILLGITWIVMALWNSLLPDIIGVRAITFWQAMGILVLSKILFGGFHFGRGMRDFKERKMRHKMMSLSGRKGEIQRSMEEPLRKRILRQEQNEQGISGISEVVK